MVTMVLVTHCRSFGKEERLGTRRSRCGYVANGHARGGGLSPGRIAYGYRERKDVRAYREDRSAQCMAVQHVRRLTYDEWMCQLLLGLLDTSRFSRRLMGSVEASDREI